MKKCPKCKGLKYLVAAFWEDFKVRCPECNGTGEVKGEEDEAACRESGRFELIKLGEREMSKGMRIRGYHRGEDGYPAEEGKKMSYYKGYVHGLKKRAWRMNFHTSNQLKGMRRIFKKYFGQYVRAITYPEAVDG